MRPQGLCLCAVLQALLLARCEGAAQQVEPALSSRVNAPIDQPGGGPPSTTEAALTRMAARAGVIFVGRVLAVNLPGTYIGSPADAAEGVVEIVFAVDIPISGVAPGGQFVLKEWSGLWAGGTPRYHAGARLLMLLHRPDASGLSSPVDGMDGAIPLFGGGAAPGLHDTTAVPGSLLVDLRWIQTKVVRNAVTDAAHPREPAPSPEVPQAAEPQLRVGLPTTEFTRTVPLPMRPITWHPSAPVADQTSSSPLERVLSLLQASSVERPADARY